MEEMTKELEVKQEEQQKQARLNQLRSQQTKAN